MKIIGPFLVNLLGWFVCLVCLYGSHIQLTWVVMIVSFLCCMGFPALFLQAFFVIEKIKERLKW